MIRCCFASVVLAGLLHSAAYGQDGKTADKDVTPKNQQPTKANGPLGPGTPTPSEGGDTEILFLDGSKVRVMVQTDKLEIAGIYGNSTVPFQDVQSIEFGLRYPPGAVEKINLAIKSLGSADYRVRETAAKNLLAFGPLAYPEVLRTTKAKEPEVAARAKDIVQKIQAKHPKKDLKVNVDDRIVTPTQTLVGRIITPSVKTKALYFGEIEHKLAHMRTLRTVTASALEMDVSVDAAKYANGAQWLDTGYQVDGRSTVVITAKGLVDTWPQQPGQWMCGPAGNMRNGGMGGGQVINPGGKIRMNVNNGNTYGGVLIGRIGENGEPFVVGERLDLKSETDGKLYLQIGPSPWGCASTGTYEVKISSKND